VHTRRVGAFLVGAWLLGSLLIAFFASTSGSAIDRFLRNPPPQVSKELEDVGPDAMRQILKHEAAEHMRHTAETWEVIQLGLGAALLVTSFLTSHRSRVMLACGLAMLAITAFMYLYLTPMMNALSRSLDFQPITASLPERENLTRYSVWYRVLEIFKVLFGLVAAARLLFDRYEWQEKLLPGRSPQNRVLRRRKHSPSGNAISSPDLPSETRRD
jgi:hypothetical protein